MSNQKQLLCLLFVFSMCLSSSAEAEVVYDSLSTSQTSAIMIGDIGNTVTLSGNKRFVTSFTINVGVGTSHIGKTNDYILRFYLPTAPGNYPGKLFWQSPPKTNVEMTGGVQSITFEVPYIRVPNTFIYSVMQAGDGYFSLCGGPIIGSSPDYCWTNLTKRDFTGSNHLQVRIEAKDRPDAMLLGKINHSSMCGSGSEYHYSMRFKMKLGGYWDLFGPAFYGVTEWDEGSHLQLKATDLPEAVNYLTNGVDESLRVQAEFSLRGNNESDTIVKSPGIAQGFPDLRGCFISHFVLGLNNIRIDHTTPGWTYYYWDVDWEIWGKPFPADMSKDGKVNLKDLAVLGNGFSDPNSYVADISGPDGNADGKVDYYDLSELCSSWLIYVKDVPLP